MTANPTQGIRIERTGSLQVTPAGRFALPLTVMKDGAAVGTSSLILTLDQVVALCADFTWLFIEANQSASERSE